MYVLHLDSQICLLSGELTFWSVGIRPRSNHQVSLFNLRLLGVPKSNLYSFEPTNGITTRPVPYKTDHAHILIHAT